MRWKMNKNIIRDSYGLYQIDEDDDEENYPIPPSEKDIRSAEGKTW